MTRIVKHCLVLPLVYDLQAPLLHVRATVSIRSGQSNGQKDSLKDCSILLPLYDHQPSLCKVGATVSTQDTLWPITIANGSQSAALQAEDHASENDRRTTGIFQ